MESAEAAHSNPPTIAALQTLFLDKAPIGMVRNLDTLFASFDSRDLMKNPMDVEKTRVLLANLVSGSDNLFRVGMQAYTFPISDQKPFEEHLIALTDLREQIGGWRIRCRTFQEIRETEAEVGLAALSTRAEIEAALKANQNRLMPDPKIRTA